MGDLDYGYVLIHQAFLEDKRATKGKLADLPALALITLNVDKANHALQPWVARTVQQLKGALAKYQSAYSKTLSYAEFHKRFLNHEPVIESVFLLGYTIARLDRLEKLPSNLLKSEFGSQFCLNLLFDLILVIDSATKPYSNGKKFIDHAAFIANKAGSLMTQKDLGDANREAARADTEKCIHLLLDQKLVATNSGFRFAGIDRDIAVSYVLRNEGGHSIAALPVISERMNEILQSAFNVLFLVVELFY
jgi:hypothetical protein